MALAYVNGNNATTTATSLTYAVDCTGADILLVGFSMTVGTVSSITYNGVAMTLAVSNTALANRDFFLYYLVAPSSGSNNVVITPSASSLIRSCAVAYSGASSTGQPDVTGSNTQGSNTVVSTAVTTVADNCFVVAYGDASVELVSRGSSGNTRQSSGSRIMFDSGTKTPAGSFTSTLSADDFDSVGIVVMSIKPSTGGGGGTPTTGFLMQYLAQQ